MTTYTLDSPLVQNLAKAICDTPLKSGAPGLGWRPTNVFTVGGLLSIDELLAMSLRFAGVLSAARPSMDPANIAEIRRLAEEIAGLATSGEVDSYVAERLEGMAAALRAASPGQGASESKAKDDWPDKLTALCGGCGSDLPVTKGAPTTTGWTSVLPLTCPRCGAKPGCELRFTAFCVVADQHYRNTVGQADALCATECPPVGHSDRCQRGHP